MRTTMNTYSRRAFTLIELMVVITIIGILIAILLPVIGAVFTSGEKAQARTEVMGLEAAVRKFYDDYNKFPPGTDEPGQEATKSLVDILSGADDTASKDANPRQKMYMEYKPSSLSGGKFVDPWGKAYWVSTDKNLDGANGTGAVRRRVLVWSGGPDGLTTPPNEKDNVASW